MEPILFVITGPSGAGKGSVMRRLLGSVPQLKKVVTYTTRPPRVGEEDGFDYRFIAADAFLAKVQAGEIFEYEQVYHDHYYGSPRDLFHADCDGLIELDYKGYQKYRARHGRVVSIFLLPPDLEELKRRILRRSEVENLEARLKNAVEQLRHADEYDYVVKNDDLDRCADTVAALVTAERLRRQGQHDLQQIMSAVERDAAGKEPS